MIQTETTKAKILLMEVPIDTQDYDKEILKLRDDSHIRYWEDGKDYLIDLPQGNWTILNTLDEVTEDEAERLVDSVKVKGWKGNVFKNYRNHISSNKDCFINADQSLQSLATSLGVQGKTIILYQLK